MSKSEAASGQYAYVNKMEQLYNRLQDELSQKIFWARLQYDIAPDMDRYIRLAEFGCDTQIPWRERFEAASAEGKKIILYGAGGTGITMAEHLTRSHMDFYAFCDRDKAGNVVCGKTVLSSQEIIDDPKQYFVMISTEIYYKEVSQFLRENGFPEASIFNLFEMWNCRSDEQYREFPELFKRGTAIVDAGCYDGADAISFAQWCAGEYSRIYAFEPDQASYFHCKANIEAANLSNVIMFQAGLSKTSGECAFVGTSGVDSHLVDTTDVKYNGTQRELEHTSVHVYALDDLADTEIGLIKMDIEGAEFDALHGAKRVIQKDRPQLAICVYHRQGDMLAIMDYLYSLVPEYRFWLRHYRATKDETVLYAAI